jgi:hypothetical protein
MIYLLIKIEEMSLGGISLAVSLEWGISEKLKPAIRK